MDFREFLKNNNVILDGGTGTILQKKGLKAGEYPEVWNITHPDVITELHRSYFDAGSNVVSANTFGANRLKFSCGELEEIIKCALYNAKKARETSVSTKEKFIALDIGPTGKLLSPLGDLDFEEAVSIFKTTVELGVKYGAELIVIETMNDSYETKAALLAVKETTDLPVIVTNAYSEDGKLMTGATPEAMSALLEGMGADAVGANCSLGPKGLFGVMRRLIAVSSVPVVFKPNAGLPRVVEGETVFDVGAEEFALDVSALMKEGVRVAGGCCGTTPDYIRELAKEAGKITPCPIEKKNITAVSSYAHAVVFEKKPLLIGERINPTGKKRFKEALKNNDIDYILREGVSEEEKGADILDVNVGLPEIDEKEMLTRAVVELQSVTTLPLQIDTSNPVALESALRRYNGKAMINSVNGKKESMEKVFPLAKKYGGVVVALTLDERGIPDTAEERIEIAKRILSVAEDYGIERRNIVFDTLTLTVSADGNAGNVTLDALEGIKKELHCHTVLGVSNVSFGLPERDAVNSVFFAMALSKGLSAAIMNPYSAEMMKAYYSFCALTGIDEGCKEYVENADRFHSEIAVSPEKKSVSYQSECQEAIIKGFKERVSELVKALLQEKSPLDIVNGEIIPALNAVGEGFENKTVFLPGLIMAAEAAKSAFEIIKDYSLKSGEKTEKKATFVIATVEGDIHDIGKNIVKLLLENYGFEVIDLGRDVSPERVLSAVTEARAEFVGLSALMTTTVPAMEETVRLIREKAPWCKTVVGGAVLTEDYAEKIGADKYAPDALEAVKFAEKIIKK